VSRYRVGPYLARTSPEISSLLTLYRRDDRMPYSAIGESQEVTHAELQTIAPRLDAVPVPTDANFATALTALKRLVATALARPDLLVVRTEA
jgi:hypothetical protein